MYMVLSLLTMAGIAWCDVLYRYNREQCCVPPSGVCNDNKMPMLFEITACTSVLPYSKINIDIKQYVTILITYVEQPSYMT